MSSTENPFFSTTPSEAQGSSEVEASGETPDKLTAMVEMVRELSAQTDAQQMVSDFGDRFRRMFTYEGFIALSRRGLESPWYRITRSSLWTTPINPWKQKDQLPVLNGGFLGELLYGDVPVIINDFRPNPDDPAYEHLKDFRSLQAVPHYHEGVGTNMAINFSTRPGAFDLGKLPDNVLTHNLFGRTTNNMVLSQQLKEANDALDAELKVVGDIQRSLLPHTLPTIEHMELAAHYHTATRAGGDYYDLFPLADGKWGILVADVSGHGTPAAVVMAATHAIAHAYTGPDGHEPCAPCAMLSYLNSRLVGKYDADTVMFVTAFYAIFDPATRTLTYSAAGHPPPRLYRDGELTALDQVGGLPLGIIDQSDYHSATVQLQPGDRITLFTDGITEAFDPSRKQYGEARLDAVLQQAGMSQAKPEDAIHVLLDDVHAFAHGMPNDDDQTILALQVT
ncbi:PP2C family protein-serine/threonine phosphatase [Algisphaera agarilytica]|uniref:Sigma-B regulation protein RsbU (Phosphoserine phosphatase) n=1 Tax=Algisphaera agarilytica TaxID=1385975 RepID=A0A7X0H3F4_9BACT|nr:PP2C family protein-serine/threonine phosphatase [Algisphaera agarilytica]MBB6428573.1 sigma-B regulation protein RsbU (phosphoserine phosphatase) [Algisphaera agarilytica]